jgi:hypothetical protein
VLSSVFRAKTEEAAEAEAQPWWLYLLVVLLSLPVVAVIIALIFHTSLRQWSAWISLPDVIAWVVFMIGNRRDSALFKYLLASIIVLYTAIFFTWFFV